ncbi:phosphotransferase [Horticoccus luteus]|uniref:Phosphotransferase n=1 Tax=Horticoccus luteus TaxID=2862869 RepID=A0A8F9TVT8_9BACT|nr:phosphotransferase [Horticoccus luteus]QYM79055.1 phosphotransferase [Horticoccus luteus]
MTPPLPRIATNEDYYRMRFSPLESWQPLLAQIFARQHLPLSAIARFSTGESPVFAVGEQWVVKLLPHFWAELADREIAALDHLRDCAVRRPRLLATGRVDDWIFLLMDRLPGERLDVLWPRLTAPERLTAAREFGAALRQLHALPPAAPANVAPPWSAFLESRLAAWPSRPSVQKLPAPLRDTGPDFIRSVLAKTPALSEADARLLHGDLAPENCLFASNPNDGAWHCSGLIDFGQARFGAPEFDFPAPTVLLGRSAAVELPATRAALLDEYFAGYGLTKPIDHELRQRLMAYSLLHPLHDVSGALALEPASLTCESWADVAPHFWP